MVEMMFDSVGADNRKEGVYENVFRKSLMRRKPLFVIELIVAVIMMTMLMTRLII